jgi:hypothetical protein
MTGDSDRERRMTMRLRDAQPREEKSASEPAPRGVGSVLATIAAATGKPLELWFQDEARVGQKNKITRRWLPYRFLPPTRTGQIQRFDDCYID